MQSVSHGLTILVMVSEPKRLTFSEVCIVDAQDVKQPLKNMSALLSKKLNTQEVATEVASFL